MCYLCALVVIADLARVTRERLHGVERVQIKRARGVVCHRKACVHRLAKRPSRRNGDNEGKAKNRARTGYGGVRGADYIIAVQIPERKQNARAQKKKQG